MKTWWLWLCATALAFAVALVWMWMPTEQVAVQVEERGAEFDGQIRLSPDEMGKEKRLALVIGNGRYKNGPLKNPTNDATAVARALKKAKFELVGGKAHLNLNQKQMKRVILDFGKALKKSGGVGLFYFAGHGMQVDGVNYLIPLGADIADEAYVDVESVSVKSVLAGMKAARNRLNLVILDACRNNPFESKFRSGGGRGLAFTNAPSGTLIAYATSPGDVAKDGAGRNGTYTEALLEHMETPGLQIEEMFKRVRTDVKTDTNDKQVPWESSSLEGNFYFLVPEKKAVVARPDCPRGMRWNGSKCVAVVDRRCPEGFEFKSGQGCVPVVMVHCPGGTRFVAGQGCVAEVVERPREEPAKAPPSDGGVKGMVRVPAGKFLRGTRGGGDGDEGPRKEIYLDGFWIDRYEVTVNEYASCYRMGVCSAPKSKGSHFNWGKLGRKNYPVNGVDWSQAVAYCKWAGKRLPTEAEWEKAARGTDGRTYPWGETEPSCEFTVMDQGGIGCGKTATQAVGSKPKGMSPYGAYDMAGNVWEWTGDWYDKVYYSASPGRNPMGPESGSRRLVRGGGGFNSDASSLRAANRDDYAPSNAHEGLGLRCARSFN